MAFIDIIKKILGNKAQRDLKEIEPHVAKIKKAYDSVIKLSNDDLRSLSDNLKQRIKDFVAEDVNRIQELKASIDRKSVV